MVAAPDTWRKQTVVIKFLFLVGEHVSNSHGLMNVYEKAAVDGNTVRRWISRVNGNPIEKETDISDRPHSGRPAADMNSNKIKEADALITSDRKIPFAVLQMIPGSVCSMEQSLGYSKVYGE